MNKKNTLLLLVCGTLFAPSAHAAQPTPEELGDRLCNGFYAMLKADIAKSSVYSAGEAYRYLSLSSTRASTIKTAATLSKITSLVPPLAAAYKAYTGLNFLIGNRNEAASLTAALIVGAIAAIPSIFDFRRSGKVAQKAKIIAFNNKNKKVKPNAYHALFGLLAAEAACSLYPSIKNHSIPEHYIRNVARAETEKNNARNEYFNEILFIDFNEDRHARNRRRDATRQRMEAANRNSAEHVGEFMRQTSSSIILSLASFVLWILRYQREGEILKKLTKKPSNIDEEDNYDEIDDDDFEDDDDE